MPKVRVNNQEIYYELHGNGKPIVLISGFTADNKFWSSVFQELSKHNQVLIFDNRCVGLSECQDKPFTIEDMAKDTMDLIDHLGLKKPTIIGHSMGGAIAQVIAHHFPQKIDKIVLSNSLIKFNKVSETIQRGFLELRKQNVDPHTQIWMDLPWLLSNEFLSNHKSVNSFIELVMNNPHPQSDIGFIRQLEALSAFDSSAWVRKIKVPTLVIAGDEDILCPKDSIALSHTIPNAKLVNFLHQAHLIPIEKPKKFVSTVVHFLKGERVLESVR
jgi:3-oxoadipate enol-lactonase